VHARFKWGKGVELNGTPRVQGSAPKTGTVLPKCSSSRALVARGGWLLEREEHCTAVPSRALVARGGWLLEREEHRTA
jgi:hypothetical protein